VRSSALLAALLVAAWLPAGAPAQPAGAELKALLLWQRGYELHVRGEYERAIEQFRQSIASHPTAEAHTYLGWSLSHLGRLDEAIAQCRQAIRLDPDFGNPYNDIGVYLIAQGKPAEAVPWLQKATSAKRYCCYQFPHFNLGRVWLEQGRIGEAARAFERALEYDPNYLPALQGLEVIRRSGLKPL
jgi:Tfp pilus assembly protein PilF